MTRPPHHPRRPHPIHDYFLTLPRRLPKEPLLRVNRSKVSLLPLGSSAPSLAFSSFMGPTGTGDAANALQKKRPTSPQMMTATTTLRWQTRRMHAQASTGRHSYVTLAQPPPQPVLSRANAESLLHRLERLALVSNGLPRRRRRCAPRILFLPFLRRPMQTGDRCPLLLGRALINNRRADGRV